MPTRLDFVRLPDATAAAGLAGFSARTNPPTDSTHRTGFHRGVVNRVGRRPRGGRVREELRAGTSHAGGVRFGGKKVRKDFQPSGHPRNMRTSFWAGGLGVELVLNSAVKNKQSRRRGSASHARLKRNHVALCGSKRCIVAAAPFGNGGTATVLSATLGARADRTRHRLRFATEVGCGFARRDRSGRPARRGTPTYGSVS
ncbi:hypothetical protein SKAU_G00409150 [Synaphobranchus kaupii]|uniref:Uncharacterized protein n=1 Tax=Synaphobranchus kaupii TaxID=118154 RepID=A0A9Q1EAP2_SYNKA|nr:hypothetical protein SKAU_G00409150 [Synaphobranchus kaupii]